MKSIKEKSLEVFPRHCNATTDESNFNKRIGFNSGANYVIEQISQALQGDLNSHSAFKLKAIKQIIEELKKK